MLDHVRKIHKNFTEFAQSGLEEAHVTLLEDILAKYSQKSGTDAYTQVPRAKKQKRDTQLVTQVQQAETSLDTELVTQAQRAKKPSLDTQLVTQVQKAKKPSIDTQLVTQVHAAKKPTPTTRLLKKSTSDTSASSRSSRPSPPSTRSRLLFAAMLDETVAAHVWAQGSTFSEHIFNFTTYKTKVY